MTNVMDRTNIIDRIKEPYDKLKKMRDQQCALAQLAVEGDEPVFYGVWAPTGERIYIISESGLEKLR